MTKRRHVQEVRELTCVEEYDFANKSYSNVVDSDNLVGCETIVSKLTHEITFPLKNPTYFELFDGGTLPVNRFIRFFGVKHSSKRTAVLSFAKTQAIYTSVIKSVLEFKPRRDLPRLMEIHQQHTAPSLIVLSNIEELFIPKQPNGPEIENCKILSACIDEIEEMCLPIWIVFLTTAKSGFLFDIDKHFSQHTLWTGILTPMLELFTIIQRMEIITICIKRYSNNADKFPWKDLSDLREFVEKYTAYCTFNEINAFVKRVFNLKRYEVCSAFAQQNSVFVASNIDELIPDANDFYRCLCREGSSIVAYPTLDENINVYCS